MEGGLSGWRPARKLKTEQSSLRVKGRQAMPSKPEHSGYPLPGAGVALAVACLAYFTPNYAQFQASPFGGVIMERFSIDPDQFSLLFTSPMIPAIFLSLVAGALIDKLGPRLVVGSGMAVSAAGCVIRVFADSYAVLLAGTALTGFAGCFITVGAAKVLAGYYGPEGVGSKMGVLMAASTLSMTVALATSAAFGDIRPAFIASSALAAVGTVLWFAVMRNPEAQVGEEPPAGPSMGECLRVVLASRNTWLVALALAFAQGGNFVVGSFAPTALADLGVDAGIAGLVASVYTLGCLVGCLTAPLLVAKLGGRQKTVLLGYLALGGVLVALCMRPSGVAAIAVLMFLAGNFVGGVIPLCFSFPVRFAEIGPVYAGTAGGVLTTIQALGIILLPSCVFAPIAGADYGAMFLLAGGSILVATLLSLAIKEG